MADNLPRLKYAAIAALNEDKQMVTRHKRPDYFLLNDELDDEASPEDQIPESNLESFIDLSPSEILPSESASHALFNYRSSFSKTAPSGPGYQLDLGSFYGVGSTYIVGYNIGDLNQCPGQGIVQNFYCGPAGWWNGEVYTCTNANYLANMCPDVPIVAYRGAFVNMLSSYSLPLFTAQSIDIVFRILASGSTTGRCADLLLDSVCYSFLAENTSIATDTATYETRIPAARN
ncbi:hypothetical protein V1504DRAFT_472180 [Lipomyces starkeyi]